ncbi:MAG: tyrosine-type recombinase/integrase [Actinomycetota bacterium]|nr:tyrosine-type recombinase/integrase [Actinomycetota bacterium]
MPVYTLPLMPPSVLRRPDFAAAAQTVWPHGAAAPITPIEPRNLTRMFAQFGVKHELRRIRLHDLRHSCVSLLLALGVHPRVVMEIVGHSAIEMTMNVYGHVNLDVQRGALNTLDEELTR